MLALMLPEGCRSMPYEEASEIVRAHQAERYPNELRRYDGQLTYMSKDKGFMGDAVFVVEEMRL